MTAAHRMLWGVNPFWPNAATAWLGMGTAIQVGVTYQQATPHPYAGAGGERYIKFDGNAFHQFNMGGTPYEWYPANDGVTSNDFPRDAPHRWAKVFSQLMRQSAANPSAATPQWTMDAGGTVGSAQIKRQSGSTTGDLFVDGASVGTFTFPTAADFIIELWIVMCDTAGIALPGNVQQFCVRKIENLATTRDVTVLLDVDVVRTKNAPSPATAWVFGESNARGAGYEFFIGNMSARWECADAPRGIVRVDHMWPNSRVTVLKDEWTTHSETNVDDTGGNVEPDQVGPDGVNVTAPVTKTQYYDNTSPQYLTSSDEILAIMTDYYFQSNADTKGNTSTMYDCISDGTTEQINVAEAGFGSNAYNKQIRIYRLNPFTGLPWTHADLLTLETGLKAEFSNSGVSKNFNASAHTVMPVYVKSGETTVAIPRPVAPYIGSLLPATNQPIFEKQRAVAY